MKLEYIILSFMLYSIMGWLYESLLCSMISYSKFVNRGFLMGPYCPIYGIGGVACWLLSQTTPNLVVLFLESMILCSVIEYITSYLMEKLFHARWWDYSKFAFNLNGRICLYGALCFASFSLLICIVLEPLFLHLFGFFSDRFLRIASALFIAAFITDIILSLTAWSQLNKRLKAFHDEFFLKTNEHMEGLSAILLEKVPVRILEKQDDLKKKAESWNRKLQRGDIRFLFAVPDIAVLLYNRINEHRKNR